MHRPIHHLSGGEKQKAALAVLFAMNPRVYLLDEPFASIDRKSRIEILEILKELASKHVGVTAKVKKHTAPTTNALTRDEVKA